MEPQSFISDAVRQPPDAIFHRMSEHLSTAYPDKFLLETESSYFAVPRYASANLCTFTPRPDVLTQLEWYWHAKYDCYAHPYNGWFEIEWEGNQLQLVSIGHQETHCRSIRHYLLGDSEEVARGFFSEVCRWNSEVRGEVLVFDQGHWHKSEELFESIQSASFENLVLTDGLIDEIRRDLAGFFTSKETYDRYGIAWKRGVLFLGPPGNGKTHAVKALVNWLEKPCLYVKSLQNEYGTEHDCIREVFDRARDTAPCILILEDLDSLLTNKNRSFFLNEMDGFASNEGILTLGTTNHPERLDPAILERPSRFDRKYTFNLPALEERIGFLQMFESRLQPELRLSENGRCLIASSTDGYSFAYLKELFLSAMMRWIAKPGEQVMDEIMMSQSDLLRAQMQQEPELAALFDTDDDEDGAFDSAMMARTMAMYRRQRR